MAGRQERAQRDDTLSQVDPDLRATDIGGLLPFRRQIWSGSRSLRAGLPE